MSQLRFGDLRTKSQLEQEYRNRKRFEQGVAIAKACLSKLAKLPELESRLYEYPHAIQGQGLEVCREANRRVRTERGENVRT